MQAPECFLIPIEIGCKEEGFLWSGFLPWVSEQDILLLLSPLNNVEDPVQTSFVPHSLHVRSHMLLVDRRGLSDHADDLRRVFLDVLVCARINEVDL